MLELRKSRDCIMQSHCLVRQGLLESLQEKSKAISLMFQQGSPDLNGYGG